MTAFNQDQKFAWLLIFCLMGGSCVLDITKAQTLTAEDRLSVLKFVGAFMNFLDLELENSTLATPESTSTSASTTSAVETTSITSSDNSTETSTEAADTSISTTTILESSSSSSSTDSTDPGSSSTTTEATTTTVRRRMCFKRFCYKFSSDKGYIV